MGRIFLIYCCSRWTLWPPPFGFGIQMTHGSCEAAYVAKICSMPHGPSGAASSSNYDQTKLHISVRGWSSRASDNKPHSLNANSLSPFCLVSHRELQASCLMLWDSHKPCRTGFFKLLLFLEMSSTAKFGISREILGSPGTTPVSDTELWEQTRVCQCVPKPAGLAESEAWAVVSTAR